MRKRDTFDLTCMYLLFSFTAAIVIMTIASCCQPKVLSKQDGFYRMKYKGTTYITDDKHTKP